MPQATVTERMQAFVEAASEKHNGKYDYGQVAAAFVNAHTKVTITCPDHGDFDQTPNEHRRGQRCPDCSGRRGSRAVVRRASFIEQARLVHGNRYDYRDVDYVDQHTPVLISCRAHGAFQQRPTNHLDASSPSNCPRCAQDVRDISLRAAWRERAQQPRKKRSGQFKKAA